MFKNSSDFTIETGVFNSTQGSLNQVIYISGDGPQDLQSRIAQNFSNEPFYSNQHRQNLRKISRGTCRWILENAAFLQWCKHGFGFPLLWIYGPPGSGKSLLCSQIIESLSNAPSTATVAYHFCDFARPFKEIEVLSMLACQLLEADANQTTLASLLPAPTNLQVKTPEYVCRLIERIATLPRGPLVYFLLDGLDEELGKTQAQCNDGIWPVLDFLKQLALRLPGRVRLLISSQRRDKIRERMPLDCNKIDIASFARDDILLYLEQAVPQIEGPTESVKQHIFQMLRAKAQCSFIWARLMVDELMHGSSSSAIMEFIEAGVLPSLEVYYRNIFFRYPRHLRPLASMVFSLVLYAKRPLRFCEIWEAVSCLSSKDASVLDPNNKPYKARLYEVFQPLIELVPMNPTRDQIEEDETQFTCHLIHSTLNDFLLRRLLCQTESESRRSVPNAWACRPTATNIFVCPDLLAKACLSYLLQFRFSQLLHKEHSQWRDLTGSPVADNRFLIYAAKYWDKHFDAVTNPSVQKLLAPIIVAFAKSQNFWTMIQVQTLWVQSHFSTFHMEKENPDANAKYLRRMLPKWFIASEDGHEISLQYKSFLRQWRYFLCCGWCSGAANSESSPYAGQLDRIWTGALGEQHFLNKRGSSLTSFPIRSDTRNQDNLLHRIFFIDLVNSTGTEAITLQISTANRPSVRKIAQYATLECECQTWGLTSGNPPYLMDTQRIQVLARHCDLHLYILDPAHPYFRFENAPLAAFASNGQALRIGSQMFKRKPDGHFVSIANFNKAKYYEEFSRSGTLVVLTSRVKISKKEVDDLNKLRGSATNQRQNFSASDDDDHWAEVGSNNSGSCSDLSYHSGSDSSMGDGVSFSTHSKTNRMERRRKRNTFARITRRISHWRSSDDSESESEDEEPLPRRHFSKNYEERDELYEDLYGKSPSYSTLRATISIYRTSVFGKPKVIFKNSFPTMFKIHGSPPVFCPRKELVVWPLGDGKVLFVDCKTRQSSTLTLRPSIFSGHITIQCSLKFSRCNQFLHVAALEARRTDPTTRDTDELGPEPDSSPITLYIAVSTYRIDPRNPTESPPALIHHVILDLKQVKGIDSRRLPFNLTWSADHVYVTWSWKILQVWRIPLFSYASTGPGSVRQLDENVDTNNPLPAMAPRNVVFMPKTCTHRSVRFFPSDDETSEPSKIVVGYETSILATKQSESLIVEDPIFCYVDEEKDLGGWVDSKSRPMEAENDEVGILESRLMEAFDSDDDLELEPYHS